LRFRVDGVETSTSTFSRTRLLKPAWVTFRV
jgi:hypothetical protein